MLKLLHTMCIHRTTCVAANLAMQKLFYTFIPYIKFHMNGSWEHRPNEKKKVRSFLFNEDNSLIVLLFLCYRKA